MREDNHDVEVLMRIFLMLRYERGSLDALWEDNPHVILPRHEKESPWCWGSAQDILVMSMWESNSLMLRYERGHSPKKVNLMLMCEKGQPWCWIMRQDGPVIVTWAWIMDNPDAAVRVRILDNPDAGIRLVSGWRGERCTECCFALGSSISGCWGGGDRYRACGRKITVMVWL